LIKLGHAGDGVRPEMRHVAVTGSVMGVFVDGEREVATNTRKRMP
jgi:hypothetical protein